MKKTALLLATCALLLMAFNIFAAEGGLFWNAICTNSSRIGGPCGEFCQANWGGDQTCSGWCNGQQMTWECENTGGQSGKLEVCACKE